MRNSAKCPSMCCKKSSHQQNVHVYVFKFRNNQTRYLIIMCLSITTRVGKLPRSQIRNYEFLLAIFTILLEVLQPAIKIFQCSIDYSVSMY
jgi:hypothetical protein